jgi:hypothetical protein
MSSILHAICVTNGGHRGSSYSIHYSHVAYLLLRWLLRVLTPNLDQHIIILEKGYRLGTPLSSPCIDIT